MRAFLQNIAGSGAAVTSQMIAAGSLDDPASSQPWLSISDHSPALPMNEVHVWRASLKAEPKMVDHLWQVISDEEKARADRFRFEIDRWRFTVGRGCLRILLGRYLRHDPAKLCIMYGDHGKPRLLNSATEELHFNLAHSGDLVLFAFTHLGGIGVDLELIRRDFVVEDFAHRFFSATEMRSLNQLPKEVRGVAFFNCWTRKEAIIKAVGKGLSLPLNSFDVTLTPGKPAKVLRTGWDENEARRWSLMELEVGQDYAAAIALKSQGWQLRQWQVQTESWNPAASVQ